MSCATSKNSKKKNFHPRAPWWSEKLLKQVKRKHVAWREYRATKSAEDYQRYILQRNKTSQVIGKARFEYEKGIIQNMKQEPKMLFKYIRSQQKVKPSVRPLEKGTGELAQTGQENAEILNEFFQSVFIDEDTGDLPDFAD